LHVFSTVTSKACINSKSEPIPVEKSIKIYFKLSRFRIHRRAMGWLHRVYSMIFIPLL